MAKDGGVNVTEFGEGTVFEGELSFTDTLIINGKFSGTIEATGELQINKGSECDVSEMKAKSVVVYGKVEGNIDGEERVELCKGSRVSGNIKTSALRIADNVEFDGSVSMVDSPAESYDKLFLSTSEEFKKSLVMKSS
ncbi:MAG: polymer-forming cytoskeletal protein [Treponema sp.]|nr:polymer-forming cytoskeletal protein [Treponema sp.]